MTYTPFRTGTYAVIDGVAHAGRYPANAEVVVLKSTARENPDPALFTWDETHKAWFADVPVERCERVYAVRTFARWRGHRVDIDAFHPPATVSAVYADTNGGWAEANGFVQVDKYEYRRDLPVAELVDVHEEQEDLLFGRWRERFPVPEGVS